MKRQFNYTNSATASGTATVAIAGGVEVAAKVYRREKKVLCKVGAESIEGIGFSDPPLGIAVKVHDGNRRALGAVCVAVLKQLGLVKDINDFQHLKRHETPEVRNCREIVTGTIVTEFELREGC